MAGGGGRGGGCRGGHGGRGTGNGRGANYQQHQSGGNCGQGSRGGHTQMANNPPSVHRPVQGQEGANRLPVAGLTSSGGATGARGRGGTWSVVVARDGAPPPQPQPQAATEIATEIDIPAFRGFQVSLKLTSQGLSLCLDYSDVALCKRMPVIDNLKENIPGFREVHDIWGKIGDVTKAPPPQPQPQPQPQAATEIDIPASLSLFVSGSSALKFNGLNYTDWSEQIYSTLNVMNLDIAIVSDEKPAAITETSSEDDKSIYGAWERSNMLSLYLMEMTMAKHIKPSMPKTEDAREFMQKVKEYSQSDLADKSIVIAHGQSYPEEQLDYRSAKFLRNISMAPPNDRRNTICQIVRSEYGPFGGQVAQNFGLEVDNMTELMARVLEPPTVKLGNSITAKLDQDKCQWNLTRKTLVKGVPILRWALLDFSAEDHNRLNQGKFVHELMSRCKSLGIRMEDPLAICSTNMDQLRSIDQTTNIWHNEVDITQEVSSKGWLQGMNLVMKENTFRHRISFGQTSYPREYKSGYDLCCGVAAFRGFQVSLKPTSQGLSLCLDYSDVALCKRMPVIDNLKENIPGFQEVHDIWGKIGDVTKAPSPQPQPQPQPQPKPQPQAATEIDIPASLSLFVSGSSALKFNGLNYTDWSEQIYSTLNVMNLDIAIVSDEKPAAITETSSEDDKSIYGAWERSNMLSLYLMEMTMAENIKPSMPKTEDAREFMRKVKEYSQSDLADKSTVGNLMDELTTKKFDWSKPIHDHVTAMSNLAGKLKTMGIDVSDIFLVQFIMNSLPAEFGLFQVKYNTMQDKWNFKELKAMLVHEEARLKKIRCFFCNKEGHVKVDCPKRKEWFEKKCTYYADLVAYRGRMYHDAMMERQSCGFMLT